MSAPTAPRRRRPVLLLCVLASAAACKDRETLEVSAQRLEQVSTVVELAWTTTEPGTSWVEYGTTEDRTRSTNTASGTDHRFELYGLPPLSQVYYRAVTETDDALLEATGTAETGSLPSALNDVQVTVHEPDREAEGEYLLATTMGDGASALVVNREGDVVWYREDDGLVEADTVLFSDVDFAHGSNDIVFNAFSTSLPHYKGAIFRVALDGEVVDRHDMEEGHHAFLQMDEGETYAYLSARPRSWYDEEEGETVTVVGDAIVEAPVGGGEVRTVFDSWDWSEVEKHDEWEAGFWDVGHDWTHANGLFYQESSGHYFVSLGYLDKVLEIDRETGEVVREYSDEGDVRFATGTTPFRFPHDPSVPTDGTLMVFSTPEDGMYNEVIEYAADLDAGILEETWSYGETNPTYSLAEGQARRLDNGNTLVSWSSAGIIREITEGGDVVWELQASLGGAVVGATLFDDFYAPGG